jgi:hypothetical protein
MRCADCLMLIAVVFVSLLLLGCTGGQSSAPPSQTPPATQPPATTPPVAMPPEPTQIAPEDITLDNLAEVAKSGQPFDCQIGMGQTIPLIFELKGQDGMLWYYTPGMFGVDERTVVISLRPKAKYTHTKFLEPSMTYPECDWIVVSGNANPDYTFTIINVDVFMEALDGPWDPGMSITCKQPSLVTADLQMINGTACYYDTWRRLGFNRTCSELFKNESSIAECVEKTWLYSRSGDDLCSNAKYSTAVVVIPNWNSLKEVGPLQKERVTLDPESEKKLRSALKSEGDSALEGIADLTCLEELELDDAGISDISALGSLTNLKSLDLSGNEISDVRALRHLTFIEDIDLSYNTISNYTVFIDLAYLKELDLEHNNISSDDCNTLKAIMFPDHEVKC